MVHLFLELSDEHAAFTTSLRLDASFVMTPRALHLEHPAAPESPPVLRPKPVNLRLGRHATTTVSTRVRPPPSLPPDSTDAVSTRVNKTGGLQKIGPGRFRINSVKTGRKPAKTGLGPTKTGLGPTKTGRFSKTGPSRFRRFSRKPAGFRRFC